jgi:transcriptional regulator with XRE-family HTH domain
VPMATRRGISKTLNSAEHKAFCTLMVETREKAGLTQHQLARKLRKPQSFVAKYEGGERRIDIIEFIWISRAIGADAVSLLRTLMRRVS